MRAILWAAGCCTIAALSANLVVGKLASVRRPAVASPAINIASRPAAASPGLGGTVVIAADGRGHFNASGAVDGRPTSFMVDTGATAVILRSDAAAAAGIRPMPADYTVTIWTANGRIAGAPVRLREVRIGGIAVRDVDALVLPSDRLEMNLLGMTFLRRLRGFDAQDDRLTLRS